MTLVEVLLASVVLVVAALPLLTSAGSMHRQSYFTEHHAMAVVRARTILDLIRAVDFDLLAQAARQQSGVSGTGTVDLNVENLLEEGGFALLFDPGAPPEDSGAQLYLRKLKNFEHKATYVQKTPDLGEIQVLVTWKDPSDRTERERHKVRLIRLVHRPEVSFTR